jgi:AraC-like DNA-binding protein
MTAPSFGRSINFRAILIVLVLFVSENHFMAQNQVTFVITEIPTYTPRTDTIYLGTSINNWVTDPQKKFKLYPDGNYRLTIDIGKTKSFQYKINRGSWNKPEGNHWGAFLENRKFVYSDSVYEVKLKVESWEDLSQSVSMHLVLVSIPENTPYDADIYVAGNFNNWRTNDSTCRLIRNKDGIYTGEIHTGYDKVFFKFTRGTWSSAEVRWDGGMRSNRVFLPKKSIENIIVNDIKAWDDLTSEMIWLLAIFFILFIQSIILLSLLWRYYRINILMILSTIIALAFLSKCLSNIYLPLLFIPAICYAFIGPWIYSWFRYSITNEPIHLRSYQLLPLLPLFWFLHYLILPEHEFYLKIVNNELMPFFFGTYLYALGLNLFFNFKLKRLITKQIANIPELNFRLYITLQRSAYLGAILLIASGICLWQKAEIKFIADWFDNLLWLEVGFVVVYFQWLFFTSTYNNVSKKDRDLDKQESISQDRWAFLKSKLPELMKTKAVYTNPGLKLSDVASYLGTNNHYVSKLINEEFGKNFTDYINAYRIEAFIESMKSNEDHSTILNHAFKAGFNSKSAFNRAFKKVTSTTPSEYFSKLK